LVAKAAIRECKCFQTGFEKSATQKSVFCSILSTDCITAELAPFNDLIADKFGDMCKVLFDFNIGELPILFSELKLSEEFKISVFL
jgi:hypothetical protein